MTTKNQTSAIKIRFDSRTVFQLLPRQLPGKIKRKLAHNPSAGFIEVLVDVRYPDGKQIKDVYSNRLDNFSEGDYVLFT